MKLHLIETKKASAGVGAQYFNSLMLPILAVWSERIGWDVMISATEPEKINYNADCDVVAICLYTYLAPEGYEVARKFRELGKIVIIGGPHAKGCSDEMKEHADLVFDRCSEKAWGETLKAIEAKKILPSLNPGQFVPSDEIEKIPPYKETRRFNQNDKVPILVSSIGCPHDCDFCADWNTQYIKREVADVIDDIKHLKSDFFVFVDPNFGANRKYTAELLEAMIPLKKTYMMETSLAWLKNEKYLELLRDSGCLAVQIGLESISTSYKKNSLKDPHDITGEISKIIDNIKEYIPAVQVSVVLGLDNDTKETFRTISDLYLNSNIDVLSPFITTPLPGTPFFDRLKAEGRLFEDDWAYYNCAELTYTLKDFDVDEFFDEMVLLYQSTHKPSIIFTKTFKNLRKYKNLKLGIYMFWFLTVRVLNTYKYVIPDLHRAKTRVKAKIAEFQLQAR